MKLEGEEIVKGKVGAGVKMVASFRHANMLLRSSTTALAGASPPVFFATEKNRAIWFARGSALGFAELSESGANRGELLAVVSHRVAAVLQHRNELINLGDEVVEVWAADALGQDALQQAVGASGQLAGEDEPAVAARARREETLGRCLEQLEHLGERGSVYVAVKCYQQQRGHAPSSTRRVAPPAISQRQRTETRTQVAMLS